MCPTSPVASTGWVGAASDEESRATDQFSNSRLPLMESIANFQSEQSVVDAGSRLSLSKSYQA